LDWVLHSAARLISGIPKFDHVAKYMYDVFCFILGQNFDDKYVPGTTAEDGGQETENTHSNLN